MVGYDVSNYSLIDILSLFRAFQSIKRKLKMAKNVVESTSGDFDAVFVSFVAPARQQQ